MCFTYGGQAEGWGLLENLSILTRLIRHAHLGNRASSLPHVSPIQPPVFNLTNATWNAAKYNNWFHRIHGRSGEDGANVSSLADKDGIIESSKSNWQKCDPVKLQAAVKELHWQAFLSVGFAREVNYRSLSPGDKSLDILQSWKDIHLYTIKLDGVGPVDNRPSTD